MSQQEDFAKFLWDGLQGRAVIARTDSTGAPSIQRFFSWPDQSTQLLAHTAKLTAEDVYTSPCLFKGTAGARKSLARAIQVVHADADGFNVEDALLPPSGIAETSDGHTHLYWKITDSHDPALIEPLAHSVSNTHDKSKTGMDNGWAVNKLLRVPGTSNTKYAKPFLVTFDGSGPVYTLAEFAAAYPPVEQTVDLFKDMGTIPSLGDAYKALSASPELLRLINKTDAHNVDRSDGIFLLCQEVFRCGGSDEVAFAICQPHPFNKFADKHNSDKLLWDDILRARSKSELGAPEADLGYTATVTVEPTPKDKSVDFLTSREKAELQTTFIDDYMAWAMSKTDAAPEYHVAAAFTVLSTVFSDFGHARPKFGPVPLAMWFMVLGETTRSRKSTTRALALKMIKALAVIPDADVDSELDYNYDLGSDVTPEALDNELLKRPNRSSLLHRDEAQGWIQEMDKKAYMAGAKGKLAELYDGHVSGKLRATGDNNRRASVETSLTLFMMGIGSQLADYLTQEDFRSGFLTRFLFIAAEPPKRTKESDWLEQADLLEIERGDEVFTGLVRRIETARAHWASFIDPTGATVPVPCVPDAWVRLNLFITDVLDAAEGHQRHQIIEASAQRMSISILKAATLLAMLDCCDKVEMKHMLAAINFASSWFGHMVTMANKISNSSWMRSQNQVEDFLLEKGGTAKWDVVYRKFRSEMDSGTFLKIITALTEAGIIHASPPEKGKDRWITRLDIETEEAA